MGWFDQSDRFQARAYVFEQPYSAPFNGDEIRLSYSLGNTKKPVHKYQVTIDELEERIGVDVLPMLRDDIERLVESVNYGDLWGAE